MDYQHSITLYFVIETKLPSPRFRDRRPTLHPPWFWDTCPNYHTFDFGIDDHYHPLNFEIDDQPTTTLISEKLPPRLPSPWFRYRWPTYHPLWLRNTGPTYNPLDWGFDGLLTTLLFCMFMVWFEFCVVILNSKNIFDIPLHLKNCEQWSLKQFVLFDEIENLLNWITNFLISTCKSIRAFLDKYFQDVT